MPFIFRLSGYAFIGAMTLSLYSKVIGHPFVNYDDSAYVTENQQVRAGVSWHTIAWAFTATEQSNWHPLTWISHAIDCQLYGMSAGGHHFTSVLLHSLNAVLVFLVLAKGWGHPCGVPWWRHCWLCTH